MTWSRSGRAVAALALAFVAAALGLVLLRGDDSSGPFGEEIARAAERTTSYPGSRIAIKGTIESSAIPGGMTMRGSGAFNGKTGRSFLRTVNSGPALPMGNFVLTQVTDGAVFYMSSPLFRGELGGKRWMKMDLSDDPIVSEAMGSSGDPREQLEMLRATSDDVELVGEEEVRGVLCKHYAATVDLERQVELFREEGNEDAAEQLEKVIEAGNGSEQDVDVWIGDGLVRRMDMTIPFGVLAQGTEANMSMEMFDFGITPRIDVPPEEEVEDVTGLANEAADRLLE